MSRSTPGAIVHRNVAVIACDTAATLQETVLRIQDLAVDVISIGDRHLALPSGEIERVLERLKEHGQFPRLVGDVDALGEDPVEGAVAPEGE